MFFINKTKVTAGKATGAIVSKNIVVPDENILYLTMIKIQNIA